MAVDKRKHNAPASGETPRRQSINDLSLSINDWIPVANATERAQLVSDLNGLSIGPTASRPLTVYRQDLGTIELTVDGTAWITISRNLDLVPTRIATGASTRAFTAASSGVFTGTFPAGRFTQLPIIHMWCADPQYGVTFSSKPTSLTAWQAQGFNGAAGINVPYHWMAIQQTETAAVG